MNKVEPIIESKTPSTASPSSNKSDVTPQPPEPKTPGRRFTVDKVNEYDTLMFDENEVANKSPKPNSALASPARPSPPKQSPPQLLPPGPNKTSSELPVSLSVNSFSGMSNSSQHQTMALSKLKSPVDKRNADGSDGSIKGHSQLNQLSIMKSTNKPFRVRSKSVGTALHKSVKIEEHPVNFC